MRRRTALAVIASGLPTSAAGCLRLSDPSDTQTQTATDTNQSPKQNSPTGDAQPQTATDTNQPPEQNSPDSDTQTESYDFEDGTLPSKWDTENGVFVTSGLGSDTTQVVECSNIDAAIQYDTKIDWTTYQIDYYLANDDGLGSLNVRLLTEDGDPSQNIAAMKHNDERTRVFDGVEPTDFATNQNEWNTIMFSKVNGGNIECTVNGVTAELNVSHEQAIPRASNDDGDAAYFDNIEISFNEI